MKQPLSFVLLTSLVASTHSHALSEPTKKPLKGYWRRIKATDEQKLASLKILKENEDERNARKKEKKEYLADLSFAKQLDKAQFLTNKKAIWEQGLKDQTKPYTFIAKFDSTYYYGANLELLNGSNQCDLYSFMQYLFDTGIYVHPHLHNLEAETIEFKAIARMKGIAGDAGKYLQTKPKTTKIGWASTEYETTSSFNRFGFWMRELWLKYYFDKDKKSFMVTGLFPYSIGHSISLGDGSQSTLGQPFPGQYTFNQIDQFRPGILLSSMFGNDQALWDLYFGFGTNYSTSFKKTAELSEAQSTKRLLNVSRGSDKHNYILASQIKASLATRNPNTQLIANPYFVINYDNTQKVEFECDARNRLYTLGGCFEWSNGPLRISLEGAQNMGHQAVRAWDRNELNFASVTWNSHLLFVNPDLVAAASYPISAAAATDETQFTHAIGIPASPTSESVLTPGAVPDSAYSRKFANGETFEIYPATGLTPSPLIYKNSHSRFRNAYKNSYRGWFIMGDIGYQCNQWHFGSAFGFLSGDESPNDSTNYILATRRFANNSSGKAFIYKDTNKTYKGFVGLNELFKSKSITPYFIHEVQKLNNPLVASQALTSAQLTNLFFIGIGAKQHSISRQKERKAECNIVAYMQHKSVLKGTNMPYTEFIDLEYSAARQTDAGKVLDTFLGIELNASIHHKLTYDLEVSGQIATFIPGKHYNDAEGKYIPFKKQSDLVIADNSGIFTVPEQFNITLGKDVAFLATIGISYSFDSLLLKNKQKAFSSQKLENGKKKIL